MTKEFYMDWEQFKARFWLGEEVYCIEEDDRFIFYVNKGEVIIKTYYIKPKTDEERLIFVQLQLSSKKDIYFVTETEDELEPIDVFYDDDMELVEDLKNGNNV